MQLDIDVSPPANIMTFKLGLIYLTFAILWEILFFLVGFFVTDARHQTDTQKRYTETDDTIHRNR